MRRLTVAALLFFLASPTRASEPDQTADIFLSAHFTRDNDQFNPIVDETDQTKDGFLWLITAASHLHRFDGKTFYYFPAPLAVTLAAAPDGDLWLGTAKGLIHVRAVDLNHFTVEGTT